MYKTIKKYKYHIAYVILYLMSYFFFRINIVPFVFIGVFSIIFFINYYFLVPKFLFKKKHIIYILSCIALITFFILFIAYIRPYVKPVVMYNFDRAERRIFRGIFQFIEIKSYIIGFSIISISSVVRYSSYIRKKEQENLRLVNENLKTELKFLKHQINPHFLFNVLNNIYSQVVTKSEKGLDSILKLSDMLRYILYESENNKVSIEKDIEYIKNYISLQKLRDESISSKVNLEYKINNSVLIEPMILISFVENAFKHSVLESDPNGYIDIDITTIDNSLYFIVKNSIPKNVYIKDKIGGVGLENVKKRLDILYFEKYLLDISQDKNYYLVKLQLRLSQN